MKLEVHERIAIIGLLPKTENYQALRTIRRAREMLGFSPDEMEFYKMKPGETSGTVVWDVAKAREQIKDVPIDEYTIGLIRNALAEKDKKHQLTEDLLSIYDKFVVMYKG